MREVCNVLNHRCTNRNYQLAYYVKNRNAEKLYAQPVNYSRYQTKKVIYSSSSWTEKIGRYRHLQLIRARAGKAMFQVSFVLLTAYPTKWSTTSILTRFKKAQENVVGK